MLAELKSAWTRMRGPEGERMRRNVARLRKSIRKSMDSGDAKRNMVGFQDYFTQP